MSKMKQDSDNHDPALVAGSFLAASMATILQELVASGAIDPEKMRKRFDRFMAQESINDAPPGDRAIIDQIIGVLQMAVPKKETEGSDDGK